MPQPAQQYGPPAHATAKPTRVRIDADAACETGNRRDPDYCLALLSLASVSQIDTAGISTVSGIVAAGESDPVMRAPGQQIRCGRGMSGVSRPACVQEPQRGHAEWPRRRR